MNLRQARLEDMPALARLYRATVRTSLPFLPELHTPDEEAAWFCERLYPLNQVWLAEDDDGYAGYVAFRADFIEHLFIRPERQTQGVGTLLLGKAREHAGEVSLWTFQQNARARRFYEKHGFTAVKETDGADNEEKMPDVLYRWRRWEHVL